MDKFEFKNKFLKSLINEYSEIDNNFIDFEKQINEFLDFLNNDKIFPSIFKDPTISRDEYMYIFNTDFEKANKIFRDEVSYDFFYVIFITAFKFKQYLELISNGLNSKNFFPYFPTLRALLENCAICYLTIHKSKPFLLEMNKNSKNFNEYHKSYQKFERIITNFTEGTKNGLLKESHGDKRNIFSILDSIDYVGENKIKYFKKHYNILSDLSHPGYVSNSYFMFGEPYEENFEKNIIRKDGEKVFLYKLKNTIYSKNFDQGLDKVKQVEYFKLITKCLFNCRDLFIDSFNIVSKNDVLICNDKKMNFIMNSNPELQKFMVNNLDEINNNFAKTFNRNKEKLNENLNKKLKKEVFDKIKSKFESEN